MLRVRVFFCLLFVLHAYLQAHPSKKPLSQAKLA